MTSARWKNAKLGKICVCVLMQKVVNNIYYS